MMHPLDSGRLAVTKLRTRKFRLIITVVVSSLLFSILFAASFSVNGVYTSLKEFNQSGLGNRYFVTGNNLNNDSYNKQSDPELVKQAIAIEKEVQVKKVAEAKRLNITYDPKTDTPYTLEGGYDGKTKSINIDIPALRELLAVSVKAEKGNMADFKATVKPYQAMDVYELLRSGMIQQNLSLIKDGVEQSSLSPSYIAPQTGLSTLPVSWSLMSRELLEPFILDGQNLDTGKDGSIPVIAPFSAAEEAIGLKPLPATAKPEEKLNRLKEVRQRSSKVTIQFCLRNPKSAEQVASAIAGQQEIIKNKNTKGYVLPDLVYDKPATACSPVVVTRDVRDAATKKTEATELKFRQDFGEQKPESQIITLRIVGLNREYTFGSASVVDIFQSMLSSSLGEGWFTPLESGGAGSLIAPIFGTNDSSQYLSIRSFITEFPDAVNTRKLLNEQNCQPDFSIRTSDSLEPFKKCIEQQKYFMITPFGNSSTAIDEFSTGFTKIFTIAILAVVAIASLIMMGTVGRIIADSRRETAVFRAIGAKRFDISQIYITYSVLVSVIIGLVSLLLGLLIALWLQDRYSDQLTTSALLSFNVQDLSRKFGMVAANKRDVSYLVLAIIFVSLLAALLPLLMNMRRNPINDMRDDR